MNEKFLFNDSCTFIVQIVTKKWSGYVVYRKDPRFDISALSKTFTMELGKHAMHSNKFSSQP